MIYKDTAERDEWGNLKAGSKPEWKKFLFEKFKTAGLKITTSQGYADQLLSFCELNTTAEVHQILDEVGLAQWAHLTPYAIIQIGKGKLEALEDICERYVTMFNDSTPVNVLPMVTQEVQDVLLRRHVSNDPAKWKDAETLQHYSIAPKRLNAQMSALKKWLLINRVIKNIRNFRQLKFEKVKAKTATLRKQPLTVDQVRQMFQLANGQDSIVLGFYALVGIRPSLVHYLKVKHFHPRSYELKDGKFKFAKMPPMLIIPEKDDKGRHAIGNKASMEYFTFIPTGMASRMELYLNSVPTLSENTQLSPAPTKSQIDYIVKKYYSKSDPPYVGRPYDLRHFASRYLNKMRAATDVPEELKEFMMGHKPEKIGSVYDIMHGITAEEEKKYRDHYRSLVDEIMTSEIFSGINPEHKRSAELIAEIAKMNGVSVEALQQILGELDKGNLTIERFTDRVGRLIERAHAQKIDVMVRRAVSEQLPAALAAHATPQAIESDEDVGRVKA